MKNQKGFTLTELIAVITVLGLIALIVIPNVISAIKSSKDTIYQAQINNIIEGAKMWASDNATSMPDTGEMLKLTLGQLKIDAYVDLKIRNSSKDDPNYFNDDLEIAITKVNGTYEYNVLQGTINYENDINTDYTKLILNGKTLTYINVGEPYVEQGAYIYGTDGSNTLNPTENTVLTNTEGTYYLYYEYENDANAVTKIIRTVIVK